MEFLVSVIVPIYKVEQYLTKCVDSICNQTYDNLEIILVDDGSPDNCPSICDRYAEKDDRIIVIHKVNGGLSSARNAGLDEMNGDFVLFVDSDDYIKADLVESMLKVSEEQSADLVICDFKYTKEEENDLEYLEKSNDKNIELKVIERIEAQKMYFDEPEKRELLTVAWNKLYKRDLFQELRFPEGALHEDEATTFKILYLADKIVYMKKPMYYYLIRNGSIMASGFNKNRFDLFKAFNSKIQFYYEHGELDLYKSMVLHYMHMLAQYGEWSHNSPGKNKSEIRKYHAILTKELKDKQVSWPIFVRFEILVFNKFNIYRCMWKIKKKIG